MKRFSAFVDHYRALGYLVLNTLVLFLIINLISFLLLKWTERKVSVSRPDLFFPEAYVDPKLPLHTSNGYIDSVLREFQICFDPQRSGFRYHPGVEYTHSPFHSKHLNIQFSPTELPYRSTLHTGQMALPDSALTIYCFGGSTTFGWYVSDEHTWPAQLMAHYTGADDERPVITRNFGVAGFSPTQETNLFLQLLTLGNRPSLCIFMDGVNSGPVWDCSEFTPVISKRFGLGPEDMLGGALKALPVMKLYDRLSGNIDFQFSGDSLHLPLEYNSKWNATIANRFIQNARIRQQIAEIYGVRIIQFLQPTIYITGSDNFMTAPLEKDSRQDPLLRNARANYRDVYQRILACGSEFIDLSGLINGYPFMPVSDGCHYSPGFNYVLAEAVSTYIRTDELPGHRTDTAQATGIGYKL